MLRPLLMSIAALLVSLATLSGTVGLLTGGAVIA
jgi:hypothetical protein